MNTIFSKIITGEIFSYKVAETDHFLAFLDIHPISNGHTLIIPKKRENDVFDLDDDSLAKLMIFAKKVSHAIREVITCKKVGVMIIGLEISHAHVHLVPINRENDLNKLHPLKRLSFTPKEMQVTAAAITDSYYKRENKKEKNNKILVTE